MKPCCEDGSYHTKEDRLCSRCTVNEVRRDIQATVCVNNETIDWFCKPPQKFQLKLSCLIKPHVQTSPAIIQVIMFEFLLNIYSGQHIKTAIIQFIKNIFSPIKIVK